MAESEAQRRVKAIIRQRAQAESDYQDQWQEAMRPTTVNALGIVRQLGNEPLQSSQVLSNAAAGAGTPVAGMSVPGGVVADWTPRIQVEEPAPVRRKKVLTFAALLSERFQTQPPAPATGTVSVRDPLYGNRIWLYWGDGSLPIQVTAQEDWQLVATDFVTVGPFTSFTKYLSDYGFSIGAYTDDGSFGLSPLVDVWIWRKAWINSQPESSIWTSTTRICRKTQESGFVVIEKTAASSDTRYEKVEIYVRDRQTCYASLSGRDVFLYSEIASWDVNDRHGGFYAKVPYLATELPDFTRFSDYPGFQGNTKDWRRGYPNFAVDGIYGDLGLCFTDNYGIGFANYSGQFEYQSNLLFESPLNNIEGVAFRYPVRENTPDSCVVGVGDFGESDAELPFSYKGVSPTVFPTYGESYFRVLFHTPLFSQA